MNLNRFFLTFFFSLLFSFVFAQVEREAVLFNMAKTSMDKGNYQEAIKSFERYFSLNEKNQKALVKTKVDHACFYLGELYIYLVDKESSDRWYAKLISRGNTYSKNYLFTRDLYGAVWALAYKKYDDAIKLASQAIHNNPNSAEAIMLRGIAYKRRGETQNANDDFNKILKFKGDLAAKAFALMEMGKPTEAIKMMEKLVKKKPRKQDYFNLASIYLAANQTNPALQNVEQAILAGLRAPFYYFVSADFEKIRKEPEYLALLKKHGVDKTPAMKKADESRENNAFQLAVALESIKYCDQFLHDFPHSEKVAQIIKFKEELGDWERTKIDPSRQNLERYLQKFPQGKFVAKANDMLKGQNIAVNSKPIKKKYCFEIDDKSTDLETRNSIQLVIDGNKAYGTTGYDWNHKTSGDYDSAYGTFYGTYTDGHVYVIELHGHSGEEPNDLYSKHLYLAHDQVLKVISGKYNVEHYAVCKEPSPEEFASEPDTILVKRKLKTTIDNQQTSHIYDFSNHGNIHVFMNDLRTALLINDRNSVARMFHFPFKDNFAYEGSSIKSMSCNSAYDLLRYQFDLIFTKGLVAGVVQGNYFIFDDEYVFEAPMDDAIRGRHTMVLGKINGVYKIVGTKFYS